MAKVVDKRKWKKVKARSLILCSYPKSLRQRMIVLAQNKDELLVKIFLKIDKQKGRDRIRVDLVADEINL